MRILSTSSTLSTSASSLLLFLTVSAGCHGRNSSPAPPLQGNQLRVAGDHTAGGEADALAAALLLSTDFPADRPGRAEIVLPDQNLRDEVVALARTHLQTAGLQAGSGAPMAGSAYIRRLASSTSAPTDSDGDGSNLSEMLVQEATDLATFAGGAVPVALRSILFPWRDGDANLAAAVDPVDPDFRTRAGRVGEVEMIQVGQAMLARLMLAGGLLEQSRAGLPGETADAGVQGLLLMQQVVAMEETIFSQLFMSADGLGGLTFPKDYSPLNGLRWLPRSIRVDNGADGLPASYAPDDPASDLSTLAVMIRAGAELAFLASTKNTNVPLRDVFHGRPFGLLPGSVPPDPPNFVSWEGGGVRTLLAQRCTSCHGSGTARSGFQAHTYDAVLRGGNRSGPNSANPIVVPGNPLGSLLYQIVTSPPGGFQFMPQGSSLNSAQQQLIGDWITDGARSAPPGPPDVGFDLVKVMFTNLFAMHLDVGTGALYERHEGDSQVRYADAAATGATLQALAAMMHLSDQIFELNFALQKTADYAVDELSDEFGWVYSYDIDADEKTVVKDLLGQARMAAGLLAAGRTLSSSSISDRGEIVAARLVAEYFDTSTSLFRATLADRSIRFSPEDLASVLDALREMNAAGVDEAEDPEDILEEFLEELVPVLVFDPDGGEFGRAPLLVGGITGGPEPTTLPTTPITWSRHIRPLFRNACVDCHLNGADQGGYRLDTPTLLRQAGDSQTSLPFIEPFVPEKSYLYSKLVDRRPVIGDQMPLALPPLSAHGVALVRQWILEGATSR